MSILKPILSALIVTWVWMGPAFSEVMVVFDNPVTYSDRVFRNGYATPPADAILDGLRRHLEELGRRYLVPSKSLEIEVLDIQLAGQLEPWKVFARDVRFMRGDTWPMIKLRYRLRNDRGTLVLAEETLRDTEYLLRARLVTAPDDPLRFEKAMLDDWFRKRFADDTLR